MAVRERHLAGIARLKEEGTVLFAVGLVDVAGRLAGSVIVCDFPDRASLDEWLRTEPYATEGVWETVAVHRCAVGPAFKG